jgi:hypothetical protein
MPVKNKIPQLYDKIELLTYIMNNNPSETSTIF